MKRIIFSLPQQFPILSCPAHVLKCFCMCLSSFERILSLLELILRSETNLTVMWYRLQNYMLLDAKLPTHKKWVKCLKVKLTGKVL